MFLRRPNWIDLRFIGFQDRTKLSNGLPYTPIARIELALSKILFPVFVEKIVQSSRLLGSLPKVIPVAEAFNIVSAHGGGIVADSADEGTVWRVDEASTLWWPKQSQVTWL